jgi:hypothetical protein
MYEFNAINFHSAVILLDPIHFDKFCFTLFLVVAVELSLILAKQLPNHLSHAPSCFCCGQF